MENKFISVVIPVYNAEKTISRVIDAILKQDAKEAVEIIAVDDGSTDASARIIQSFPTVQYIQQKNKGPAAARNRGIKESRGDLVFFTDSDCIPEKNWISTVTNIFKEPKIAVVSGTYNISNPDSLLACVIHREIIYRHRYRMPKFPKSFGSYNFCVRKSVFNEVGGFNESYAHASGEDNDLSYKIIKAGYQIYFEEKSVVYHFHPTRILKYLFEQYRHGYWRVKMYFDHPQMIKGDDYTYWKDMMEPAIVMFSMLSILFSILNIAYFLKVSFFFIITLAIIELFYGFLITKNISEGIFLCLIMFLRSFARTFGFLAGTPVFLQKSLIKKMK